MALIAGRDFSHLDDVDFEKTLLTASATRALGYDRPEEAVGTTFVQYHVRGYTTTWDVIGVVEDFHYESLHHPIRPAFIQNIRPQGFWLVVRLTGDIPAGLVSLEEIWRRFVPHLPVQPVFLDQEYARFYASERRLSEALTWVSGLAVTVACMGILALSAFAAQQRTKEIGIRKALGASAASIVGMLSSDFARLVLAAGVVAAPLAWLAADRWLAGYAYRLELGWLPFVFACLLTTLAATLAVGLQTLRAAMANPVEALRYE